MKSNRSAKPRPSRASAVYKPEARSRVTNGKAMLPAVDGRSVWVRRFRDVLALHLVDLGGEASVSEAEKAIARRAACLVVELEQMEQRFALNDGATVAQLEAYQRASNSMRRLLESLGLKRRARDITPTLEQYAEEIAA